MLRSMRPNKTEIVLGGCGERLVRVTGERLRRGG